MFIIIATTIGFISIFVWVSSAYGAIIRYADNSAKQYVCLIIGTIAAWTAAVSSYVLTWARLATPLTPRLRDLSEGIGTGCLAFTALALIMSYRLWQARARNAEDMSIDRENA